MQVSADQIASLRAYLEGDFDRHRSLHAQLDGNASVAESMLLTASFFRAVGRRFPKGTKASDVVDFVGDVRARYEGLTDKLDPRVAERLIRAMLTGEDIDDLDTAASIETKFLLLYVLIADEQLDEAGLDEFLTDSRALADRWLAED